MIDESYVGRKVLIDTSRIRGGFEPRLTNYLTNRVALHPSKILSLLKKSSSYSSTECWVIHPYGYKLSRADIESFYENTQVYVSVPNIEMYLGAPGIWVKDIDFDRGTVRFY